MRSCSCPLQKRSDSAGGGREVSIAQQLTPLLAIVRYVCVNIMYCRLALAMRHALYEEPTVYAGPRPLHAATALAAATDTASTSASAAAAAAAPCSVQVHFETQPGAGGVSLDAEADCPSVVLDIYCRRAQKLGFELQIGGVWQAPQSVALISPQVVELTAAAKDVGATPAAAVERVRYAYSDWPVVSLRNKIGGLPARIFDIAVDTATGSGGSHVKE